MTGLASRVGQTLRFSMRQQSLPGLQAALKRMLAVSLHFGARRQDALRQPSSSQAKKLLSTADPPGVWTFAALPLASAQHLRNGRAFSTCRFALCAGSHLPRAATRL